MTARKHKNFLAGTLCISLAVGLTLTEYWRTTPSKLIDNAPIKPAKVDIKPPKVDPTVPKLMPLKVESGDTLAGMLSRLGIHTQQIHNCIQPLGKVFKPQDLKPKHNLEVTVVKDSHEAEHYNLLELRIRPDIETEVIVSQGDDGSFMAEKQAIELEEEVRYAEGPIEGSLYKEAMAQGVPQSMIHTMIMAYSFDVDFQRSIRSGDTWNIMYSVHVDPKTGRERPGQLLFAALTLGGKKLAIYHYDSKNGHSGFYNKNGESVRKGLLRTPLEGFRISSGFGNRRHPVLGFTKQHKGIDFAAPTGTPIMAAGSGVVERIGSWSSYGNYVRIRHNGEYSTAYAHLSRYAKGLKKGARVKQGDIIGYVGATGRTTGAHLHYEILRHAKQVNPLGVKMLPTTKLTGKDLNQFKKTVQEADQTYLALSDQPRTVGGKVVKTA